MPLTLVPSPRTERTWRRGVWVRISISLIVAGLVALGSAAGFAIHWYYSLDALHTEGTVFAGTVSMKAGGVQVIDERVSTSAGYQYSVDVRRVTVRVTTNTAGATVELETCPPGDGAPGAVAQLGGSTCATPRAFQPGAMSLGSERLLVRVHPTRPGTVVVDGLNVSYREGIRHTTQHVGLAITVVVRP